MRKNKKHLIWLWLLLIASIIISGQVEATNDFWTISIANPNNPSEWFIIMDRNLGATSNDISNPNSYWYYYQWWNNHGFPSSKEVEKISANQIDASSYWPWNYYENDTFIIWNNWDSSNNKNLWWWGDDNENNWRWLEINNPEERQWPCPQWYHIPSLWEWLLLVKYWADTNNKTYKYYPERGVLELDNWYSEFRSYFKIPLAGEYYVSESDNILESNYRNYLAGNDYEYDSVHIRFQWSQSHYRTSSPAITSTSPNHARSFYMDDIFYFYVGNTDTRNRSSSVRCFKNTYEPAVTTDNEDINEDNVAVTTDDEDINEDNAILTNNITKTVEINPNQNNRKTIFNGTYTALNDNVKFNYYFVDTSYDPDKDNNFIKKRCEKNKTEMTFYLYIDWKLAKTTHMFDTCNLWQWAGFGSWIDEISLNKWQTKKIKIEIEVEWSVQEDDTYNFRLYLDKHNKDSQDLFNWGRSTDFAPIKILHSTKENNDDTKITYDTWSTANNTNNWYSKEMNDAYEYAYNNWITTINSIEKAKINSSLTRIAMAKMLSYYAINVLGQKPDTSKWTPIFSDVNDNLNKQYNNAVTLSYQLWIMWQNMKNNSFRPNYEVTRAEFATALSRMLYNIEDWKWKSKYYEPHISKLYDNGIINRTNPNIKEKRWYVMLMLMRSVR